MAVALLQQHDAQRRTLMRPAAHEGERSPEVTSTHGPIIAPMSPLAKPELFWSTDRVAAKLDDPHVRIVDCRFAFDRDLREAYLTGHVPGAVYCDWSTDL